MDRFIQLRVSWQTNRRIKSPENRLLRRDRATLRQSPQRIEALERNVERRFAEQPPQWRHIAVSVANIPGISPGPPGKEAELVRVGPRRGNARL
ncbi:hypothetical protein [Burkholderia arboris]|uniref:hypothetical protein n=1 Tax=Burkholderia arboris TaxID=488730 RepID=UPI00158B405E|nr:hypothetical protein [Burkholderia arboris]